MALSSADNLRIIGTHKAARVNFIADALPPELVSVLPLEQLDLMRQNLQRLPAPPERPRLTKRDWIGALGLCLLSFLSTFPVSGSDSKVVASPSYVRFTLGSDEKSGHANIDALGHKRSYGKSKDEGARTTRITFCLVASTLRCASTRPHQ
jgi:hypothetical protein